ncbi:MAG TPA: VanZ family protein [Kiritimatiellae bacterium]|nr:VanZ family protein [Kiritimatiellia bacterium]
MKVSPAVRVRVTSDQKLRALVDRRRKILWIAVFLWTAVIYLTIPVARRVQTFIGEHWGRQQFQYVVYMGITLGLGGMLLVAVRSSWGRLRPRHAWIAVVGLVYYRLASGLRLSPEEAIHFLEYGVLGVLLVLAFGRTHPNRAAYAAALLAGTVLGTFDEILQWLAPRRFWDLRDIAMNAVGVALGVAALGLGLRPDGLRAAVRLPTWRLLCRLGWAAVVGLLFCLVSTPDLIARYAQWTGLKFLLHSESMLAEYGCRIVDPEIGIFYSRFAPERLRAMDRERGRETGRALRECRVLGSSSRFRKAVSAAVDPFLHEAGLHLIRRNYYLSVLPEHRADSADAAFHARVAWSENRILEKYFPETLRYSGRALPEIQLRELEHLASGWRDFESIVSNHLITFFSRRQVVLVGGAILAFLLAADMVLGRVARKSAGRGA